MSNWYAQASGSADAIGWNNAPNGSGDTLTWPCAEWDTLYANNFGVSLPNNCPTVLLEGVEGDLGSFSASGTYQHGFHLGDSSTIGLSLSGDCKFPGFTVGASGTLTYGNYSLTMTGATDIYGTLSGGADYLYLGVNGYILIESGAVWPGKVWTQDMSAYVLKSAVVSASYVLTGHDNYTGGSAGSYPANPAVYQGGQQLVSFPSVITLPTVAQVQDGVDFFDVGGAAEMTGTFTHTSDYQAKSASVLLSAISAGVVKKDEEIDATAGESKVIGTYDPAADSVWPDQENVSTTEDEWGPNGDDYAGQLDLSNLEAGNIRSGVIVGGVTGTFAGSGSTVIIVL